MPARTIAGIDLPSELVSTLGAGSCVAFVGAGLSMPAYPGWEELYGKLALRLQKRSGRKANIGRLSDLYNACNDKTQWWEAIAEILGDRQLNDRIKARYDNLALTNWKGIATWNLDEQIRAGFARVGRPLEYCLSWADAQENPETLTNLISKHANWIIQLHGDRYRPLQAVLGTHDYAKVWGSSQGAWDKALVGPTLMAGLSRMVVLFFGCSFDDPAVFSNSLVKVRSASFCCNWYALLSEKRAESIAEKLRLLKITPLPYRNRSGMHEEVDFLLRELHYYFGSTRPRGVREAQLRTDGVRSADVKVKDRELRDAYQMSRRIKFGGIDLASKLLPSELWRTSRTAGSVNAGIFFDDEEQADQVHIVFANAPPLQKEMNSSLN
jgi:hypothetical protein